MAIPRGRAPAGGRSRVPGRPCDPRSFTQSYRKGWLQRAEPPACSCGACSKLPGGWTGPDQSLL